MKQTKAWAVISEKGKLLDVKRTKRGEGFSDVPIEFFGAEIVPVLISFPKSNKPKKN